MLIGGELYAATPTGNRPVNFETLELTRSQANKMLMILSASISARITKGEPPVGSSGEVYASAPDAELQRNDGTFVKTEFHNRGAEKSPAWDENRVLMYGDISMPVRYGHKESDVLFVPFQTLKNGDIVCAIIPVGIARGAKVSFRCGEKFYSIQPPLCDFYYVEVGTYTLIPESAPHNYLNKAGR